MRISAQLIHATSGAHLWADRFDGSLADIFDLQDKVARQAVAKHLAVLEEANLVSWKRRGREKLHFINPVPINEIAERWVSKFERPRLRALSELKKDLEGERDD